jgi:hypothetical protein
MLSRVLRTKPRAVSTLSARHISTRALQQVSNFPIQGVVHTLTLRNRSTNPLQPPTHFQAQPFATQIYSREDLLVSAHIHLRRQCPTLSLAVLKPRLAQSQETTACQLPFLLRYVFPPSYPSIKLIHHQHYDLAFKTDLSTSPPTFSGEALIHLDIHESTSTLTFNVHHTLKITHIAITTSELKSTSTHVLDLSKLKIDKDKERGSVDLGELPGGWLKEGSKGKIWFRFESELSGNMMGYYKSVGDTDSETGIKPV